MTPIARLTTEQRRCIRAVLFDIDDTITLHGKLPACAYEAMEKLHEAGLIVVPITGRPAGWCDLIARIWPVDGVVGENGAFYFRHDHDAQRMERYFWQDEQTRRENRLQLQRIADEVLEVVPAARVAADQGYRETDLAIDICEDVTPLSDDEIESVLAVFERHGATAKLSSIHVNGWYGSYDKCTMALRLLHEIFDYDTYQALKEAVYVGDSPNDAPMFEFFPNTVGVANIKRFTEQLDATPRWVTTEPGGRGFAEFVRLLLAEA